MGQRQIQAQGTTRCAHMGIRDIQRKIKLDEAMKKKALELKTTELEAKARTTKWTKERIAEFAKTHGVLLAFDPSLQAEVEEIRKEYNIPKGRIISEQMTEEKCLKGKKVDSANLGMLAYQRVLLEREETGGLLTIGEVYDRVNTGVLKGVISAQDVEKAVEFLHKQDIIAGFNELDNGGKIVSFFPVQFTADQSIILNFAAKKGFVTLEEVSMNLKWSTDRAMRALEHLQKIGVARFDESYRTGKKWYFPSLGK